jgi:Phosphatidate cytidylyltransferase, mitochondrial
MRGLSWALPAEHAQRLRVMLGATSLRPAGSDWEAFVSSVRDRAPERAHAIVGYGSWYTEGLRKPSSFPDVYLIVDDDRRFHENAFHARWNRMLPPNVYFLWGEDGGRRRIRGKYNVISRRDLERETSAQLRDLYNAGRLTKLVWIGWVRDEATRVWLIDRLVAAQCTLAPAALALLPARFSPEDFSLELLALSYRGEARLEGWERVRALYAAHAASYRALHRVLLEAFAEATGLLEAEGSDAFRKRSSSQWPRLACSTSRLLRRSRRRGYLRWLRILLTEPNLVDLAANEAERKAGVRIRLTPRLRRHPLVFGLPEFLRVLRERNTQERIARKPGGGSRPPTDR